MTKNTKTVSPFVDASRTRARSIQSRAESMGSTITLTQAYELLAAADGHRTWAAMRASADLVAAAKMPTPKTFDAYVSAVITRRLSLDIHAAEGMEDVASLLKAAGAELGYYFFDGEETPSMRFRNIDLRPTLDDYFVVVDIEVPPGVTDADAFLAKGMTKASRDNTLTWGKAPHEFEWGDLVDAADSDAVFSGSGKRERNLPWTRVSTEPKQEGIIRR